ncbi:hypothetical protein DBR06_SOUSAS13710014, partial [Sousa chinensis]
FICRNKNKKTAEPQSQSRENRRPPPGFPSPTPARTLCARARTRSPPGGSGGRQKVGREGGGREGSWLALPASFLTSVNGSIATGFACRLRDDRNGGSNSEKEKKNQKGQDLTIRQWQEGLGSSSLLQVIWLKGHFYTFIIMKK